MRSVSTRRSRWVRDWSCTWVLVSSSSPRACSRTSPATDLASSVATPATCLAWSLACSVVDPWLSASPIRRSVSVDVLMELVVIWFLPVSTCVDDREYPPHPRRYGRKALKTRELTRWAGGRPELSPFWAKRRIASTRVPRCLREVRRAAAAAQPRRRCLGRSLGGLRRRVGGKPAWIAQATAWLRLEASILR